MTKREEIREGIIRLMSECYSRGISGRESPVFKPQKFLKELIPYLHSAGCVLKVERELPNVPQAEIAPMYDKVFREGINAGQYNMRKAGYVAVESLVEKK